MLVKVIDGVAEKYTLKKLLEDNPNTSFPTNPDDTILAEFNVYPLKSTPKPTVDHTKEVIEGDPELVVGEWHQTWVVTDSSTEKLEENIHAIKVEIQNRRKRAFEIEADPLFFKWQRGETDEQTYINKVNEIRARYPYPDGIE